MVAVSSVTDLGILSRPENVIRDGGTSVKMSPTSSKMAWIFADSMISGSFSTNSMAFANVSSPRSLLSISPVTNQFIPFTSSELAYNNSHDTTRERYAIWPSTAVRRHDGMIVISYEIIHITPAAWIVSSVGVAFTKDFQTITRHETFVNSGRVDEWDSGYSWPTISRNRKYIFMYCLSKDDGDWFSRSVKVAKVPAGQVEKTSSYRFWNGTTWSPNIQESVYVVPGSAGAAAQFHATWNSYLGLWIGVYMTIGSVARLITAPSPKGPWSDSIDLFTGRTPKSGSFDYALVQHPELQKRDGKVIFLTYAHPVDTWDADMPFVRVVFA